jgi:dihydroorotase
MIHPFNHHLVDSAMVHEGVVSVDLGMKGIPTASETSALLADIELAKWLKVPLRILGISSKESLEIVKKAKSDGVDIKCSVPIMNLLHDEHDLIDFDERFKVIPPLRSKADKEALKYGVLDGSIDAISTNHTPEDIESQKREFEYADFGADTLSGFGGMLLEVFGEINLPKAMQVLSSGNREFLSLSSVEVVEGAKADLTIYNPKQVENPAESGSKAFNRVQISATVTGGVVATIRGSRVVH